MHETYAKASHFNAERLLSHLLHNHIASNKHRLETKERVLYYIHI